LQGIVWTRHGGRDLLKRLETLRAGLAGLPEVPVLPLPIVYLRPISLLVWDIPSGVRFSSLIGTKDGLEAAEKVARALAALHRAPIAIDSVRSLDQELLLWRRKAEHLGSDRPDLLAGALALLEKVEGCARKIPPSLVPMVRTLHPHHILVGERVAIAKVEEVALSHPLVDVGELLARLELFGIDHENTVKATQAADRFRLAFCEAGAASEDAIAVFEAGALLRLACAQAKQAPDAMTSERLLERAAARLIS
jgi:hypothetical protein